MPKYKFKVSYNGTNYHGWQQQPDQITVQGEIKNALKRLFPKDHISLPGSGRTDAGVHAIGQIASITVSQTYFTSKKLEKVLNAHLPDDILISDVETTSEEFHPTIDAKTRKYCYRISKKKSVFIKNILWYRYFDQLKINKMQEALNYLKGEHDFTTYSNALAEKKYKFCTIIDAEIIEMGDIIEIWIEGNRFLHNMVRRIVGTLFWISEKNLSPKFALEILEKKDRTLCGRTISPSGLTLEYVKY